LRAIGDIGTHWMDLVQSMTGLHVEQVFADLATIHPVRRRPKGEVETFTGKLRQDDELESVPIDTEDMGCMLFRFEGGARGMVHVSQVTAGRKNCLRYEVAGTKCAVAWDSEEPNSLWVGYRDRPNESLVRDPALLGALARGFANYPGGHAEGFPDTFKQCFRAFYQAVSNKTPAAEVLYPTFADGHREVVLCEAILKSHQEQRWVTLEG
jgi:predicted dehydrogenase